jgi:formylglycine-generating enzyme required for sulfatase activity
MAENSQNTCSDIALTAGQRRLYELIDSSLLEFGSLEPRKKAILALTKELKIGKEQLKELVNKARVNHPQINAVARVHKLVQDARASGKKPDLTMFRRLQPAAKSAGKDDIWLGQQLGYMPKFLEEASRKKNKHSKTVMGLVILLLFAGIGGLVWWTTYGAMIFEQRKQDILDKSAWQESVQLDTRGAYRSYLRNHPAGLFFADANARISELDEIAWEQASIENTRQAYEEYIKQYSIHDIQANSRLDGLLTGDLFRDCLGCPEMIVLPAGEFQMGSRNGDIDELPLRRIRIERPIAVSRFEVTFSEWDLCALSGDCARDVYDSTFGRGQQPVINVSWEDAQDYINWISGESGIRYRLLTEAEWEYASRGGANTDFWWGNSLIADKAVCIGCVSNWSNESPAQVGQYGANGYGLYDMAGNVAEWLQDCKHMDYKGAPVSGLSWMAESGGDCSQAVIRGGSWLSHPNEMRSADRAFARRNYSDHSIGFRVARDLN